MDEKLRFIAYLLDGEKMAPLCREFGISRKTGYKIYERYPHVHCPAISTVHAVLALNVSKPGHPEQNGRHERMHLTLKREATKPPAYNLLQQQEMFDYFTKTYNEERPHQGINMKYPAQLYTPSMREYHGLPDIGYPLHDRTITITTCGRICIGRRKINVSSVFAGQKVGIREVNDKIWLVSFMKYDIGFFDEHENKNRTGCTKPV